MDTKEKIYWAAVDLFYKKGFNGTSLRDICSKAGIRASSFYYHYGSKQGILYVVLVRSTSEATKLLRRELKSIEGAECRLRAAIRAHIEWHTSRQQEAFIADAELPRLHSPYREEVMKFRRHHEQIFNEIIEAGADTLKLRTNDAHLLTRLILTGATGVSSWYSAKGTYDAATISDAYCEALLGGIRASASENAGKQDGRTSAVDSTRTIE